MKLDDYTRLREDRIQLICDLVDGAERNLDSDLDRLTIRMMAEATQIRSSRARHKRGQDEANEQRLKPPQRRAKNNDLYLQKLAEATNIYRHSPLLIAILAILSIVVVTFFCTQSAAAASQPQAAGKLDDGLLATSETENFHELERQEDFEPDLVRSNRRQSPDSSSDGGHEDGGEDLLESAASEDETLISQTQAYDYHANMPVITKRELAAAIKQSTSLVDKLNSFRHDELVTNPLEQDDNLVDTNSEVAAWLASSMFHKPAPNDLFVLNQTRLALIAEETTHQLAKQYKLSGLQILRGLPLISVDQTPLGRQCPRPARIFSCVPGRYRSISGHCNSVQQPDWGAAQTALVRYAPAHYADNISKPVRATRDKTTANNLPLPSARQISLAIYESAAQLVGGPTGSDTSSNSSQMPVQVHSHMTTMMSFFGQFVFHDLAFVPQISKSLKCCSPNGPHQASKSISAECMPIEMKQSSFCLDYVRSLPAIRTGCNLGPRDQLNLVSSFLDGSVIYGSSEAQMRQLRTFSGGRLRSQRLNQQQQAASGSGRASGQLELLPQIRWQMASNESDPHWSAAAGECLKMVRMRHKRRQTRSSDQGQLMQQMNMNCFQAGDTRVNENIGLTLMHTIWLREHNSIADKLAQLNRHWHDERLFEETRRIVVAELQQITFAELLRNILGDDTLQRFNLTIQSQGYFQGYDPNLNPGISNELAVAVFPLILATIPSSLERYSDRLEMLGTTQLAETFLDSSELFKRNKFAQYLMGMMSQSAMEPALGLVPMTMDSMRFMSGDTSTEAASTNESINGTSTAPQLDAVALAIQQGRDHGLKGYVYWRRACQLRPAVKDWSDLVQVMPAATVTKLRQVYASVNQIDLYLGLLENRAPGSAVGPTFACLLARQFYQLKHGDRFWFENDLPDVAFTPKQLDEIRQTSLAKVLCRNAQNSISFVQPTPMLASDPFLNAYQYCTNRAMLDLDLSQWRQPVHSAQQVSDEQLVNELAQASGLGKPENFGNGPALSRGKRMIESATQMMAEQVQVIGSKLDSIARDEASRIRSAMMAKMRARRSSDSIQTGDHKQHQAGYRYLPRPKRQALSINNQSVIYELATNEVVRSLLRQGKDREQPASIHSEIRDFLYSLESIQLENLLDNSAASDQIEQFIASANSGFLAEEQRVRLAASGDPTLSSDPLNEILTSSVAASRSSSVSMNCQDDDRVYPCDHTTPFRSITGWCNNLLHPKFGQSFTLHDRILPSAYQDGLSKPRQLSVVKEANQRLRLPSARLVSTTMHDDKTQLHARYSLALMQFGQFGVDHDLTRTPFSVALDGTLLDCSSCDSQRSLHRDCLPIEVPENDAHYHPRSSPTSSSQPAARRKCLHFVRSLNGQLGLGPRQQLNALTAYIDASQVYGSDNCEAKSLRSFTGGRLNASLYPVQSLPANLNYQPREILPVTRMNPECVTPSGLCFHAGDQRASEQPGLTAIHTIFMRLHNSIADQLAAINRHWQDEKIYQMARRIVGAILQRITYNEFAPRLLGLDYMSRFDLILKQVGYAPADHYDDTCSASILTEFASAAFRMGHSLIRGAFPLLDRQYKQSVKSIPLRTAFFNSHRILSEPQLIDSILRGIVTTPIESLDNSVTEELTNHLFERPREPLSGMDLIALNIQRARDHGIPGYNRYRVKCNLTRAQSFDDLAGEIPARLVKRLSQLYASVDDIDLFTGGLSELPVHGGMVGPTFGCIIGLQLNRLKRCDRFWHETSDPFVRFSPSQLAELRKMTLAKVICSQSDRIDTIQRQAMDVPDNYLNPRESCSSLPDLDLSAWRENQKSCQTGTKIRIELGHSKRVSPCKSCTCTLEGLNCRSAKINCVKLMQRGPRQGNMAMNQIMSDKACLVQCAWALDMQKASV